MSLPINLFMWTIAVLPIAVLLILMVQFKCGANKASPIGLMIAIISSIIFFKAGVSVICTELLKALWNALSVIIIMFTAVLIYEVTNESKAFNVLKNAVAKIAPNELLRIIGIGIVFSSFLQGVTGFGVPVAVTAPLLIGIGVRPIWAVIIPLIGHSWGGTFGTLAIAWQSLIVQTGINDISLINQTAIFAAGFLFLLNFVSIISVCFFYGGKKALKKGFIAILLISLAQGGGQLLFGQINQTLACFIPSLMALIIFFLLNKSKYYKSKWNITDSPIMQRIENKAEIALDNKENMNIHEAFLPYYIMTGITLAVLLIPSINHFLGHFSVSPAFNKTVTGYGIVNEKVSSYSPIKPLAHAGTFLFLSALCGFAYYFKKGYLLSGSYKVILHKTLKKMIPSSIAVVSLIMMSRIMSGTGQITVLALEVSKILGPYYSIIAPFIGLIGSFITGSNMSSNILFGDFQLATSKLLVLNSSAILGAHTAGGAIGTAISPGNIVLGTTTADILGCEGKILRKILPIALIIALILGLILYILN
ncbi:L-lactate permease [Candidatus Clostridium stratigraminis]|uniref:L-lactate permease n=1 Tax=Candidatus Clostridium stratigraminis TaxID=3381661 RepID=A0ABW8T8J7_9CLOT